MDPTNFNKAIELFTQHIFEFYKDNWDNPYAVHLDYLFNDDGKRLRSMIKREFEANANGKFDTSMLTSLYYSMSAEKIGTITIDSYRDDSPVNVEWDGEGTHSCERVKHYFERLQSCLEIDLTHFAGTIVINANEKTCSIKGSILYPIDVKYMPKSY